MQEGFQIWISLRKQGEILSTILLFLYCNFRAELQIERAARVEAESQAQLLSKEKEKENLKLKELEDIRKELEELL